MVCLLQISFGQSSQAGLKTHRANDRLSDRRITDLGGGEETGIITAQIDPARIAKARGMVPSLQHDRGFTPPELARLPLAAG